MTIEIKVPILPESVSDATISKWYKKPGEPIKRDEHLLDIETDKVVLEVVAPEDGSLETILKKEGDTVIGEEVVAKFQPGKTTGKDSANTKDKAQNEVFVKSEQPTTSEKQTRDEKPVDKSADKSTASQKEAMLSPAVRRLVSERDIKIEEIQGSGKGGRITKEDVLKTKTPTPTTPPIEFPIGERVEKRVPMSRLRARIAERLLQAQQTAAILTTFNEINMKPIMDLRQKYKEVFEKTHGIRLGIMSFFTMAAVEALKRFPVINASIDGNDIVYHGYYDIGIAVASPRGLVVPILRNVEALNMAQIEKQIAAFGQKAKDGQLSIEEMTGGTFTLSNGGVFGSLMSTPILNPPQSAIVGMHKIEDRAVVENGQIVIRPMMYVALSYDHRIIDGSESVRFLVTIKELLEDPARFLLEI